MSEASPAPDERIRINVGGTVFETSLSTLTRIGDSVLSMMVADRWRNGRELFVDRDPTHFRIVLNYLRDGENVVLPKDGTSRDCLRREAEFYNLPQLSKMCLDQFPRIFKRGDVVKWNESAIKAYSGVLIEAYEFADDDYSIFPSFIPKCIFCPFESEPFSYGRKIPSYKPLEHHMLYMRGEVERVYGISCCDVKWGSLRFLVRTHMPHTALCLAEVTGT